MIVRLQGLLTSVQADSVDIEVTSGLTLRVLVPALATTRLGGSIGRAVSLHTLTYLDSQNQGATLVPRLAGFLTVEDRAFFELFVTCKGIGYRKALRAMALPSHQIAAAIADRDAATLQALPEIGKRSAETIIAALKGKVEPFVAESTYGESAAIASDVLGQPGKAGKTGKAEQAGEPSPSRVAAREALEVLLQLGEQRIAAMTWIDQIMQRDDHPEDAQGIVEAVYRLKAGG